MNRTNRVRGGWAKLVSKQLKAHSIFEIVSRQCVHQSKRRPRFHLQTQGHHRHHLYLFDEKTKTRTMKTMLVSVSWRLMMLRQIGRQGQTASPWREQPHSTAWHRNQDSGCADDECSIIRCQNCRRMVYPCLIEVDWEWWPDDRDDEAASARGIAANLRDETEATRLQEWTIAVGRIQTLLGQQRLDQ